MTGRRGGSSDRCSVVAMCVRIACTRAWSTAIAARRASSSASSRSAAPSIRPLSDVVASCIVPITRSPTTIGTMSIERVSMIRISSA